MEETPELPDVGVEIVPTEQDIVEGRVGNGTWPKLNSELTKRIQLERREMKIELAQGRREAYENGVRDTLGSIGQLESGILEIGEKILQRVEDGELKLGKNDLALLKLAQKTAEDMKNRALGKPTTHHEVKSQSSILHLIAGIQPDGD